MAKKDRDAIRGILQSQEIDPGVTWRDPRNLSQKFSDFMADPNSFLTLMGSICAIYLIVPAFFFVLFYACPLHSFHRKRKRLKKKWISIKVFS